MNENHFTRRNFLKGATATVALSALGGRAMGLAAPDKVYRVGLIGTGWYGKSDLFRLIQVSPVEVVALCDVDRHQLENAAAMVAQRQRSRATPKLYGDYRKMLAENKLDIVLVGTPDHWHALIMIAAVKAGAHVYVQKPISVDVIEGEAMVAAARKYNRVVQVGTQRKSTPHLIEAKEKIVEAGLLGKVSHITICATTATRPCSRCRTFSTMRCGPVRRPCGPMTASPMYAGGVPSWNTATASWGTCASTCSTPCAGC